MFASSIVGPRYLMTLPSAMVKRMRPLHFTHLPRSGGLRYFSLHVTHLNSCMLNFRRLPLVSLRKCFSITNVATSLVSTARTRSAMAICPTSFSCMDGSVLYALHLTVLLMSSMSCVNPMPSYCWALPRWSLSRGSLTSQGMWYCSAAS